MNLFRVNSMIHLFLLCFPSVCLLFLASMSLLPDESAIEILVRFGLVAIPLTLGCLAFFWKSQTASFLLLLMWFSLSIILANIGCTYLQWDDVSGDNDVAFALFAVGVALPLYGSVSTYAWLKWIWISSLTRGELKSGGILTG